MEEKNAFILNPKTGRFILKGGNLHKRLMKLGDMPVRSFPSKSKKMKKIVVSNSS